MKRFRPLYLILSLVCLFILLPTNALAKTVSLDPIADRDPRKLDDYNLTISGSAQVPEVTIKVFQGDTLIYFDVVQLIGGSFILPLQLSSPIPNNTTFTVVAGLGQGENNVDSQTFKFFYNSGGSSGGGSESSSTETGGSPPPPKKPEEFSLRLLDDVPQDLADALSCKCEVVADLTPSFSDIVGHWAIEDIEKAVYFGLVNGYPDQTFRPEHSISRLEFSLILHRALQLRGDVPTLTFADKQQIPQWAEADIARAVQAGLIRGYNDNTFRPEQAIRRSEITTMLIRALQVNTNLSEITNFLDDGDIPAWAKPSVAAALELGLIQGRDGHLFAPNANTTRAEAAVLALRLLETID